MYFTLLHMKPDHNASQRGRGEAVSSTLKWIIYFITIVR